jgi:hypothetical protein
MCNFHDLAGCRKVGIKILIRAYFSIILGWWRSENSPHQLFHWSAADLAKESALGANTIRRAEVAEEGTSLTGANELAIRRALEAAGVEFIDENGGGPGVRLRKPGKERPPK